MLLTSKVAKQDFPRWTDEHQHIFWFKLKHSGAVNAWQ
jgi:hypothetical protein